MDADLEDELQFHLEQAVQQNLDRGMDSTEARRRARIDLGGVEPLKDMTRDSWGVRLVESCLQDAAYAIRVLRKRSGFSLAVVLSLALGIGANTAIFTLMDAVIWRALPVKDPGQLVVVSRQQGQSSSTGFVYRSFRLFQEQATLIDVAGYANVPINVVIDGPPEPSVRGQLVTGNYFRVLGVSAAAGRTIGPEDDRIPDGHPVVMLSDRYWERRFARDPSVVGRTIRVSNMPFTIVGIAPAGFFGADIGTSPDLFLPLMMQPTVAPTFENLLVDPIVQRTWVKTIARANPGVGSGRAAAELDLIFQRDLRATLPDPPREPITIGLTPAGETSGLRRQFQEPLSILLGMVGVVLLIACANTANLVLARAAARRPEFGLRMALGSGRRRLMRQLLIENAILAVSGGVCGILLAQLGTHLLVGFISSGRTPIALDLSPNLRILTFTVVVSLLTGVLFGLVPARRAARIDVAATISSSRSAAGRPLRPGRALSVAQLALSLLLLVAAGLCIRSLRNLSGDDQGHLRANVLTMKVEPKGSDQRGVPGVSDRLDRIYQDLIRRVQGMPGVKVASMANSLPTAPTSSSGTRIKSAAGEDLVVPQLMVYPDYFQAIGVPLVRGREFTAADLLPSAPPQCIVNETFARKVFPDREPIGQPCELGRLPRQPGTDPSIPMPRVPFVIVGVVKDARYGNPNGEVPPLIFTTFAQTNTGRGQMVLFVRVEGPVDGARTGLRQAVAAVDPTVPMFEIHSLEEEMNAALVERRLIALLSTLFGGLALLLACLGLYGLLAFGVAERTSELGVRLALGASRGQVLWLVMRDAMILVAIGIGIGTPVALGTAALLSRQLPDLLYRLDVMDPSIVAAAIGVLGSVAIFAAFWPARRAARVDPMLVLRRE